MILQGAEPFYHLGSSTGILLLHGLTGSPAEMYLLGEVLSKADFTVLAVRLPGHGTIPEDLERVKAGDWLAAAMDGYALLASNSHIKKIAVIGQSMGALLALKLAVMRRVSHVISVAAPFLIQEERGLALLPAREKSKGLFLPKKQSRLSGIPTRCIVGYAVMPLLAVHELLTLTESVKDILPQLEVPLLVFQGLRDHTVCPESAQYIIDHAGSTVKKIVMLPQSGHRVLLGEDRDRVFSEVIKFLKMKDEKI